MHIHAAKLPKPHLFLEHPGRKHHVGHKLYTTNGGQQGLCRVACMHAGHQYNISKQHCIDLLSAAVSAVRHAAAFVPMQPLSLPPSHAPNDTKLATFPSENKLTPICHSRSLLQGHKGGQKRGQHRRTAHEVVCAHGVLCAGSASAWNHKLTAAVVHTPASDPALTR